MIKGADTELQLLTEPARSPHSQTVNELLAHPLTQRAPTRTPRQHG